MSQIRKNSLRATVWIFGGFLIGAINTYFFTHKSWFNTEQYGLTRVMVEISQLLYAFSSFGVISYLSKFFPYYEDNIENKKNDLLGVALIIGMIGFSITIAGSLVIQPMIVRKFSQNSILLVEYFYWTLPMGFFVLLYTILETYSYGFKKGVLTSLLRETVLRFYTMIIIVLKITGFINFKIFLIAFSFQYAVIVVILIIHLKREKKLWLTFKISRVTKKYRKKIFALLSLTFIVIVVNVLRSSVDGLVLAAKQNLGKVGIFGFAAYIVSVLQAPYRSLVAITVPLLSRAWKEKNYFEIDRIYRRSSINLLTFALFIFFCVWLNYAPGITFFAMNSEYLEGRWVFFILSMVTIIELGTGVNGQIIGTSVFWKFELWTSLLLTALIIPLSYLLTVKYGIIGPAIANLLSFSVYNGVRFLFLWKKFAMQPFTGKTLEVILLALMAYSLSYILFNRLTGLGGLVCRSVFFSAIYGGGLFLRKITPDLLPLISNIRKRFSLKT